MPIHEELPLGGEQAPTEPGWRVFTVVDENKAAGTIKRRVISAPNKPMRTVHRRIVSEVSQLPLNFEYATGNLPGRSVTLNALAHRYNRYFYQLDIANAYGQVDMAALAEILFTHGLGNDPEEVKKILDLYCKSPVGTGLAMGGPASPLLFNTYCVPMDEEIAAYCQSMGITYTRFLDDLTFSKFDHGFPTRDTVTTPERRALKSIIASYDLPIQPDKTRISDIHDGPIKVTGVQINPGGRIQLPTMYLRRSLRDLKKANRDLPPELAREYAAGLNGLLNVVKDPERPPTTDQVRLGAEVLRVMEATKKRPVEYDYR